VVAIFVCLSYGLSESSIDPVTWPTDLNICLPAIISTFSASSKQSNLLFLFWRLRAIHFGQIRHEAVIPTETKKPINDGPDVIPWEATS
jgi:hypothetical protein